MLLSPPPVSSSHAAIDAATDAATTLASVRVMLGHSDGINDVASVVTVRIVLRLFPIPASSRLDYVLMSVRLLNWFVIESAMDTRVECLKGGMNGDSPAPEARSERSDGREHKGERGGRIGGTSSRLLVRVSLSCPSVSAPGAVQAIAVLPVTMSSGSGVRREMLLNRNKVRDSERVDDERDEGAATFDGKRLREKRKL